MLLLVVLRMSLGNRPAHLSFHGPELQKWEVRNKHDLQCLILTNSHVFLCCYLLKMTFGTLSSKVGANLLEISLTEALLELHFGVPKSNLDSTMGTIDHHLSSLGRCWVLIVLGRRHRFAMVMNLCDTTRPFARSLRSAMRIGSVRVKVILTSLTFVLSHRGMIVNFQVEVGNVI